jgi:hypothetical protein
MAHRELVTAMAEEMVRDTLNRRSTRNGRIKIMNATFRNLSALAIAFSMSMAASPAYSQGKGKAKGKQNVDTKEKHGRTAGGLPFGLEQFSEKKGNLPSGLQKKKDEDGWLTRGLEEGGKRSKSTGKAKKGSK